jgi:mRNA-degrading endonuclease toxin of MazEF toxin-antitoxin module
MEENYQIDVHVKEKMGKEIFRESYEITLSKDFVENTKPKEHGVQNHIRHFVENLKQNNTSVEKQVYKKRQIYVVNYGLNVGSEINGSRPSIIYKDTGSTFGDDVTVIPLTSANYEKKADRYDIFVTKDDSNKLYQNSYARLRQIGCVSVKKIGKAVGTITDEKTIEEINEAMKKML